MGATTYIFQENRPDGHDPWELGDSEPICGITSCLAQCGLYLHFQSRRRYVIHDVPADDQENNRLVLGQVLTTPDCPGPDYDGHSIVILDEMIRADHIIPVAVDTDSGDPYVAGFPISGLYNNRYEKPLTQQVTCYAEEVEYECETQNDLAGRWVIPILRIIDWPGWFIRLHITGSMPNCVGFPMAFRDIARMVFSINHTASWSYSLYEINQDRDLWDQFGYDYCVMQPPVNFYVFFPVLFCDTTLDMWLMTQAIPVNDHDEQYLNLPVDSASPFCRGPTLDIEEARLFKELPAP